MLMNSPRTGVGPAVVLRRCHALGDGAQADEADRERKSPRHRPGVRARASRSWSIIMDDLNGRVALVTGASRGIGRDIALALAAAGCSVAVAYNKDKAGAEAVVGEIKEGGQQAVALTGDVAKPDAAAALVRDTESQLGPIGILVNNAGINPVKPLDQITAEDWDEMIRVNLSSLSTSPKRRFLDCAPASGDGSSSCH